MPGIVRLSNCTVYIYPDDHGAPHFHVLGPGWAVKVSLETLEPIVGKGPRADLKEAIEWAKDHPETLSNAWRTLNERD
jgi:hypothetical protein